LNLIEIIKAFIYMNIVVTIGVLLGSVLVPESILLQSIWLIYTVTNVSGLIGLKIRLMESE